MTASVINFQDLKLKSWTDRDLAEIHRVAHSLERAGMRVETESGLTDEGDPWYVICDAASGEVLIHFARIGSRYVAAVLCLGYRLEGSRLPRLANANWSSARLGQLRRLPISQSNDTY